MSKDKIKIFLKEAAICLATCLFFYIIAEILYLTLKKIGLMPLA